MSWSEFFAMGGHGFFVWGSYGVAALLMAGEALAVWKRHQRAQRQMQALRQELNLAEEEGSQ